jgi:hypothetical protein
MPKGGQSLHRQRYIGQKAFGVQSLTTPASAPERRRCHTPHIWHGAADSSLEIQGATPTALRPVVRNHCSHSLFHRYVSASPGTSRRPAGQLQYPAIEYIGTARAKALGATVFHQRGISAMGLFTKDIKTMNDLFVHQLQDIYYAEKQLVKALPKMAGKASDKQLKQGFLTHLEETKTHVQRL